MKAEVTFRILWSEEESGHNVKIFCGNVEGDGLTVPVYMAILKALQQVEDKINGKAEPPVETPAAPDDHPHRLTAEEIKRDYTTTPPMGSQPNITTLEELQEKIQQTSDGARRYVTDHPDAIPTPPTPKTVVSAPSKKPKRYTVEEKTEIAMMYAEGMPVATIAEKFGREPQAIRLLIYKMGVKRGDNPADPEQADVRKPASKSGSVLKKPWYLQSQKPNNKEKVKHE